MVHGRLPRTAALIATATLAGIGIAAPGAAAATDPPDVRITDVTFRGETCPGSTGVAWSGRVSGVEIFHSSFGALAGWVLAIETPSAAITITQPQDIALYAKTWRQLHVMARYGRDARRLITGALDEL
ncbi:hypothetical protein [Pilimelia anulata]|nr:hypothetical protein [Pilimelia anulata]